jgi:oxygen-dependent protoporphyrinogen oxidase
LIARSVIVATPAFVTAKLTEGFSPELARELLEIPYVSSATVSVGFDESDIPCHFDGYGYVSPRAGGGPIVACSWTSNKFPARVEEERVLIRFFLGRAGQEEVASADEETIREAVRRELKEIFRIEKEPRLWRIYRWYRGLPQYHVGHLDRLARIWEEAARFPGLLLAGSPYRGVGIPDCIESGWQAATSVQERSRIEASEVESDRAIQGG